MIALLPLLLVNVLLSSTSVKYLPRVIALSVFIAFGLYLYWAILKRAIFYVVYALFSLSVLGVILFFVADTYLLPLAFLLVFLALVLLPRDRRIGEINAQWADVMLSHPARVLLVSFFLLCSFGTILLLLPWSSASSPLNLVDAAFTSVSAVCVTGLIVKDTPIDFSGFGQCAILLLIQLGGLGIMSITTMALHAMGRRLSLKQERLMVSMTDTDHNELLDSLSRIFKYTFIIEGIGAVSLSLLFYNYGDRLGYACFRGVFTAVSAFCNAGFALQSENLLPYQDQPLILHMVALLIILGGMAPATVLLVPRWLRGRVTPLPARIALVTTVIMLFSGTLFILIFEWNGFLNDLSIFGKFNNAWFQSVTLRTAGFNSVDLSGCTSPTYLLMLAFMFIGGSPGGTAGGIKTTAAGVLMMTFWANIVNHRSVIVQNKRIAAATIYRAVTIVIAGLVVWFLGVMMLEVTQQIPARELIYEVTSALGTVGLTIGATPQLDEIGKVIVIFVMFAGRVGPISLFMLMSNNNYTDDSGYLSEKISLT